jgi:hypothetical protein
MPSAIVSFHSFPQILKKEKKPFFVVDFLSSLMSFSFRHKLHCSSITKELCQIRYGVSRPKI